MNAICVCMTMNRNFCNRLGNHFQVCSQRDGNHCRQCAAVLGGTRAGRWTHGGDQAARVSGESTRVVVLYSLAIMP